MEFILLLVVTLAIAVLVSLLVVIFFKKSVNRIFERIIGEEIYHAWSKFLIFAIFVVGVSSGVRIRKLEEFIKPETENFTRPVLNAQYWGLEIYRTIIDTLGGIAWALLIFFIIALMAYAIIRLQETKT